MTPEHYPDNHYIQRCKHCQTVMSQCRCPGPKEEVEGECEKCLAAAPPPANVVSLAQIKADKSQDCRDWTPRDALAEALRQIDAGEMKPEMIYIACRTLIGEDAVDYNHFSAGGDRMQLVGLLSYHKARIIG